MFTNYPMPPTYQIVRPAHFSLAQSYAADSTTESSINTQQSINQYQSMPIINQSISDHQQQPSSTKPARAKRDPNRPKRPYKRRVRKRSPETIQRAQRVRRYKANDRERSRMHSLNDALETLRCTLPLTQNEDGEKLTKIETLRMAHNYILNLSRMLGSESPIMAQLENQAQSGLVSPRSGTGSCLSEYSNPMQTPSCAQQTIPNCDRWKMDLPNQNSSIDSSIIDLQPPVVTSTNIDQINPDFHWNGINEQNFAGYLMM